MSDEPNTNVFADEIFADKITATESIEVDEIKSNKVVITGELDAATITGDGSKLTGVLNGFTFPSVDGNSGDVLQTNGNKALSFATASSWTVHKTYNSTTPSYEVTDLDNPQVVKFVFSEIRHSLGGRNHMFIGGATYEDSGYYDTGYNIGNLGANLIQQSKQVNKFNWYPLDYHMTSTNGLYSGEIILSKVSTGNDILPYYWTYTSHVDCGLAYSGWVAMPDWYIIHWKGHNLDFTSALNRVKLENGNGGNYTGNLTILSQR